MVQRGLAVGVDVGGTKVAGGLVTADGVVVARRVEPTPSSSAQAVAETIARVVGLLSASPEATDAGGIVGVGVGAAGFVDAERSRVLFAPNLAWRDEPLKAHLSDLIGLPIVVENDANAMAWAEFRFGSGSGVDDLVCLTIGTGIGAGIVLGGTLVRGAFGIGGEAGHVRVVPDGRPCGCGNHGCWEQYCSGRALALAARTRAHQDPAAARLLAELAGEDLAALTGEEVTQAARAGDPVALAAFAEVAGWLGQGMADLAAVLDPGRFVIGGGVGDAGELLLAPARVAYAQALSGRGHRPLAQIVGATLGAEAGLVGAADLVRGH